MPLSSSRIVQNHINPRAARQPERTGTAQHHRPNATRAVLATTKPRAEIVADEAAHETSRSEDLVQLADVLLDGVCCLGENQQQENELASVFHKNS